MIYDGLLIVWVMFEYLYEVNKFCVFFVMYYYEMIVFVGKFDGVDNVMVSVKEWDGEIIFLYDVKCGVVDCSYGV